MYRLPMTHCIYCTCPMPQEPCTPNEAPRGFCSTDCAQAHALEIMQRFKELANIDLIPRHNAA